MLKKLGRTRTLFLLILILLVVAGTSVVVAHAMPQPTPTILEVTRPKNPLRPQLAVINKRITNAAAVQKLYQAVLTLPEVSPSATYNCPADDGTKYQLAFLEQGTKIRTMELQITGCQWLVIDTGNIFNPEDSRHTNSAFDDLFSHTIGLANANDLDK